MKGKFRYVIIICVLTMATINYIERGILSYAQASIIQEFGFSPAAWGAVLGYFGYGYAVGGLLGGMLADKKGPRWVWIWAGVSWSLAVALTAFAGNVGIAIFGGSALAGFAIFRIIFGLAEGPVYANMNRTMANWTSPKERGFTTSIGLAATPLGALITAPVAVLLFTLFSWKIALILLGAIGLVFTLLWTRVFTDKPEDNPRVTKEELAKIRSGETRVPELEDSSIPWYHFFKNPSLVLNLVGFFAGSYTTFMLLFWMPKYLQDVHHLQLSSLAYYGVIPWILPCITILLGGRLSDYLKRKTNNLRIARCGINITSLMIITICFFLIPNVKSLAGILVLIALGNGGSFLANTTYWLVIVDTEPSKIGTYGGISHFVAQSASIAAPVLTGLLVTAYGYSAMFMAAGTIAGIAIITQLFVKPGKRVANAK